MKHSRAIIAAVVIVLAGIAGFLAFFSVGSGEMVYVRDDAALARERGEHLLSRRLHSTDRVKRAELLSKAIEEFKRAIELKPDFAVAYNMLGHCYLERGQWETALKHLNKAIELRPDYPAATYNRGKVYQHLSVGKRDTQLIDKAIEDYRTALASELAANFSGDLHKSLADAFHQKGELDKAIAELEAYLAQSPRANDAMLIRRKIRGLTLMLKGSAPPLGAAKGKPR
ncbi:MAG: tetratricopeptide repeat protein [Deltaproteobacteria bacterium]|nr:tetratricopeptide repeat protein [Deltaproteobacteria bacterium]